MCALLASFGSLNLCACSVVWYGCPAFAMELDLATAEAGAGLPGSSALPTSAIAPLSGPSTPVASVPSTHHDVGTDASAELHPLVLFSTGMAQTDLTFSADWLGFQLFSPYYQPICGAVRAAPARDLQQVKESIQQAAPLDPYGLADRLVALQPQRFSGYAGFLRYPSAWDAVDNGQIAVVIDLSHVGGHYFAACLPAVLSDEEFFLYVAPHCTEDTDELQIFLGFSTQPAAPRTDLTLSPGVVLTVLRRGVRPLPWHDILDLFRDGAAWGRTEHLPLQCTLTPGVCVMTAQHRFFLHERHHYRNSLENAIAERLHCSESDITVCQHDGLFRFDLHGDPCHSCAVVLDLPRPDDDLLQGRRDVCTLLDFRPLGHRPRHWHSHFPALHIPSILAHFGLRLPDGLQFVVHGGCREDDDVYVRSRDVLVFEAKPTAAPLPTGVPRPPADSSSDSDDSSGSDADSGLPSVPSTTAAAPSNRKRKERRDSDARRPPPSNSKSVSANPQPTAPHDFDARWMASATSFTNLGLDAEPWDVCLFAVHSFLSPRQGAPLHCAKPFMGQRRPSKQTGLQASQPRMAHGTGDFHSGGYPSDAAVTRPDHPGPPDHRDRPHQRGPPDVLQDVAATGPALPRTQHVFMVLVPDMAPELVAVPLATPVTVQEVLPLIVADRSPQYQADFPDLVPVYPQLDPAYGVFVARPSWAPSVRVVCVDTRAIDDRAFAMPFPEQLNRESLLRLIRLRDVPGLQIFVAGAPFGRGQALFRHGDTVLVRWGGRHDPPVHSLASMLSSSEGWHPEAEVSLGPLDMHVLVLTDGIHHLQTVDSYQRATFKQDLALALQYSVHRTSLKPAFPRVTDCSYRGFYCHSVVVATEAICRLPVPPARPRPEQLAILLDKRPVLRGFTWFLCEGEHFDLQDLQRTLQQEAPPGYVVDVRGGHRFLHRGRPRVMARQGLVLQVRFVPPAVPPDEDEASGDDDADSSTDPADDDSVVHGPHPDVEDSSSTPRAPRSRSPPPDAPRGPPPPQPVNRGGFRNGCATIVVGKWFSGVCRDALAESNRIITSAPLGLALPCCVPALIFLLVLGGLLAQWTSWLWHHSASLDVLHMPRFGLPVRTFAFLLLLLLHARPVGGMVDPTDLAQSAATLVATPLEGKTSRAISSAHLDSGLFRPLPTPCRTSLASWPLPAMSLPVESQADIDMEGLQTPLEESIRRPGFSGFLDSVVILEAAWEHLLDAGPPFLADPSTPPLPMACPLTAEVRAPDPPRLNCAVGCPLALQDLLPPTAFQLEAQDLQELLRRLRASKDLEALHTDWLDSDLTPLWQDPEASEDGIKTPDPGQPYKLEIYTDGSAQWDHTQQGLSPAAWAFSVWLYTEQGPFLLGVAAHSLVPEGTPFWVGEHSDTPLVSELAALCWAQAWALEYGIHYQLPMLFCYDATSAGAGTFGASRQAKVPVPSTARAPEDEGAASTISEFACLLRQCLVRMAHVEHHHVHGHSGCLPNELVDQLSKQARRTHEDPYDRNLPVWPSRLASHRLRHWAWLAAAPDPHLPVLAALQAEASRLQSTPCRVSPPDFGLSQVHRPRAEVVFSLAFASYNVLTLFTPDAPKGRVKRHAQRGMLVAGKRDLLKKQFLARNLWAIGLQETRFTADEVMQDQDFLMLCTAADSQGSYGCALWLNLGLPLTPGQPSTKVRRDQVVVTSFSPRHLLTQVDADRLRLTILVAHAPRGKASDVAEAEAFWQARQTEVARRPEGSEFILLTDSNSHLGSVHTDAVGPHDGETENLAGAVFHSFLLATHSFLPSTFSCYHQGSSWTWIAPGADTARHRLDFVALP
ncbi:unnamed protein product [Symbiodinium sp. CCMP2592]|nr:unnamed protein product [Symbiodinium sp. CCMP2592]